MNDSLTYESLLAFFRKMEDAGPPTIPVPFTVVCHPLDAPRYEQLFSEIGLL
jgi:hypothetical protein